MEIDQESIKGLVWSTSNLSCVRLSALTVKFTWLVKPIKNCKTSGTAIC